MKLLNTLIILLMLLTFSFKLKAQDPAIDSLKLALKNAKHDTTRCNILNLLIESENDDNVWPEYNVQLLKLAEKGLNASASSNNHHSKISRNFYLKHYASALNNIGFLAEQQGNIPKALEYYNKSLKILEEIRDKNGIAVSLNNIGIIYNNQGDIPKALDYYNKSLKIQEEIKDKKGMATSLINIGVIYNNQGDTPKGLEYFHRSLKIQEEIKDEYGIANSLNNIGGIYQYQDHIAKALECYQKSLKIREQINDKSGIANSLNNIGGIYQNHGDPSCKSTIENCRKAAQAIALDYYNRSLVIQEELQDKLGIATSLSNMGLIYYSQAETKQHTDSKARRKQLIKKALDYFNKSLKIREEINDKRGVAYALNHIGSILFKQGNTLEAMSYVTRSMQISKELGFPENIKNAAEGLKQIYKKQNQFNKALEMYELEILMRDSISNESTKKTSIKKQFQYQYEKKAAADSLINVEEQKVKNAQLEAQQSQLKQEKTQRFTLYGGLVLLLIFAGFMFNRFKVTSKQKQIIELKEIETQKQNEIITHQKHIVEESRKEIVDSINYAKRIQYALLANGDLLKQNLKDYFVLFKPKDIVSGDFYWATEHDNKFYLAVCDSTGHGVPGAFMCLLNMGFLSEAIKEKNISEPNEVLNYVRQRLIDSIGNEGQQDGMDAILICIDKNTSGETERRNITYAAANNEPILMRENQIIELPKDKMPVGKGDKMDSFKLQTINGQKGDMLYLYTDGYADQFGGPKGKKFKYKPLNELLLSVCNHDTVKQREILENNFTDWKGNLEQVDDMLVIGIQI